MFGNDQDDSNKPSDVITPPATDTDTGDAKADSDWQHPGPPPADDDSDDTANTSDTPTPPPPVDNSEPSEEFSAGHNSQTEDISAPHASGGAANDDLIDLKQQALTKLAPLVDKLDQAPDEKFRTLMMMIQASDDQSLVKEAYETAQKIDDEKERAQALLDIVNEINYFTQNPSKPE